MNTPSETKSTAAPTLLEIPVGQIMPDPKNRKEHDLAKLRSLADAIGAEGLLQPILVRETGGRTAGACYQIVAGERRWRAFMLLKREKIPAIVLTDADNALVGAARKRLVENLQREDLTPIEEARQFRELTVDHKMTQADVAKLAGCSQPAIANALRLLELPAAVQQMIQDGALTRAHGVTLVRFAKWRKVCARIAELAIKHQPTTKDLEADPLPFAQVLVREKLAVSCNPYDWKRSADYVLPRELGKDPAFVKTSSRDFFCLEPEKWAPEKARQDAEFAKKRTAAKKTETSRQSKMSPKQKEERQKLIAGNKRKRAETATRLAEALARLKSTKAIDRITLAVVIEKVLTDFHYRSRIKDAAAKIGLNLPAGLIAVQSYFTSISFKKMLELSEVDLVRLTAATVAIHHAEWAHKSAGGVPEEVERLTGKAKKARAS